MATEGRKAEEALFLDQATVKMTGRSCQRRRRKRGQPWPCPSNGFLRKNCKYREGIESGELSFTPVQGASGPEKSRGQQAAGHLEGTQSGESGLDVRPQRSAGRWGLE